MTTNDRNRVFIDEHYAYALGQATYVFAYLEWCAVYCAEALNPGYINCVSKKTAGTIARELIGSVEAVSDECLRNKLLPVANEFLRLVSSRNDLVHANPCTASDRSQLLNRNGRTWTLKEINEVADEFAACAIDLNQLYHGPLSSHRRSITS